MTDRVRIEMLPGRDPAPTRIESGAHATHEGGRVGAVELSTTTKRSTEALMDEIVELRERLDRCRCGA